MRVVREDAGPHSVTLYDFEPTPDRFCDDVCDGLRKTPKRLPSKYFYDATGAVLFERIMELDAYYPTRTEIGILRRHADEIAARIGPEACLVEFGSGSGDKTWILLGHLQSPAVYVPVDISRAQLLEFAHQVGEEFPTLPVIPVCADYTGDLELPAAVRKGGCTVAFFPGSTLGNFEPAEARGFLRQVRRMVGAGGGMLIGLDLRKDPAVIELAYNDPEGVTAEFNLNLLRRINRECGANFDPETFHHHAFFDSQESRVEMRLVSDAPQEVALRPDPDVAATSTVRFDPDEFIVTEYSYKFELSSFGEMAAEAGWEIEEVWTDERKWFAVLLLR